MSKLIDLTGRRFGRLIVIGRNYPNTKSGNTRWLCKCECGKLTIITNHNLRKSNGTKSCGCLQREATIVENKKRSLDSGLGNMRKLIESYKCGASKRGYIYELTEKQFKEITQEDCYYCGMKPNNIASSKGTNGAYIYNGIDRVDNSKGYTIDNVVPCCKQCNYAKNTLTQEEFREWIERVYLY